MCYEQHKELSISYIILINFSLDIIVLVGATESDRIYWHS